jgi:hypothetical protein
MKNKMNRKEEEGMYVRRTWPDNPAYESDQ